MSIQNDNQWIDHQNQPLPPLPSDIAEPEFNQPLPITPRVASINRVVTELAKLNIGPSVKPSTLEYVKITRNQDGLWDITYTQKQTSGLWNRFVNKVREIFYGPEHLNDLKEASDFFDEVREILDDPAAPLEKDNIENALEGLKKLYEQHRKQTSAEELVFKNDIVEALSSAYGTKEGGSINEKLNLSITRIAADILPVIGRTLRSHQIPLFKADDLPRVNEIFARDFRGRAPTIAQIQAHPELGKLLIKEDVSLGWLVENIYKHDIGSLLNNRVVNWGITKMMEHRTRKKMAEGDQRTEAVVNFFKGLHINLSTDVKGELYSYREMHGRDVRSEETLDGAFQRPLTPQALEILLKESKEITRNIQKTCGAKVAPVICNAFCRVRVLQVGAGKADQPFSITGKVLDDDQRASDEVSYAGKFKFTIRGMFGSSDGKDAGVRREPITNPVSAERRFRSFLFDAVNKKDLTMVVQRLAPADIHHYGMSVGGEILSISEACKVLERMLQNKTDPAEIQQLKELIKWYQNEGKEHDKALVEVKGTRQSVSTLAVKSGTPLSQNDRKIMMVRHDDGTISIHTFIGAVGVNHVNIYAEEGFYEIGEALGSMGFGDDPHRSDWANESVTSIHVDRNKGEKVKQGADIGSFEIGGSTVVSIYFREDFVATPAMAEKNALVQYKDKKGNMVHDIEVLTPWGKPVALPSAFVALEYFRGILSLKGGAWPQLNKFFEHDVNFTSLKNPEKDVLTMLQKQYREYQQGTPLPELHLLRKVAEGIRKISS